jgi:hypothetical protein
MLLWIFSLVLVCGTRAQSLSAPRSYILYIYIYKQTRGGFMAIYVCYLPLFMLCRSHAAVVGGSSIFETVSYEG